MTEPNEPLGGGQQVIPPAASGEPQPSPPVTVTDPFANKTTDELKKMLNDAQDMINRQAGELGTARNRAELVEQRLLEELALRNQPEPEPTAVPQPAPAWDYDKPVDSTRVIIRDELSRWQKDRAKEEQQRYMNEAKSCFFEGRENAYNSNKKLYEGIEQIVETALIGSHRNNQIDNAALRNPKLWERTAQLIRLDRGELDRIVPPRVSPVSAVPGQLPIGAKPQDFGVSSEPEIILDEGDYRFMREEGITEAQARERIKKELDAVKRGANRGGR